VTDSKLFSTAPISDCTAQGIPKPVHRAKPTVPPVRFALKRGASPMTGRVTSMAAASICMTVGIQCLAVAFTSIKICHEMS